MVHHGIDNSVTIDVRLSPTLGFSGDLREELAIDTGDLRGELLRNVAKQAMWETCKQLSERRVSMMETDDKRYHLATLQHELLQAVCEAFYHRKTALMELWENPRRTYVLEKYQSNLSHLWAFEGILPYEPEQEEVAWEN